MPRRWTWRDLGWFEPGGNKAGDGREENARLDGKLYFGLRGIGGSDIDGDAFVHFQGYED